MDEYDKEMPGMLDKEKYEYRFGDFFVLQIDRVTKEEKDVTDKLGYFIFMKNRIMHDYDYTQDFISFWEKKKRLKEKEKPETVEDLKKQRSELSYIDAVLINPNRHLSTFKFT